MCPSRGPVRRASASAARAGPRTRSPRTAARRGDHEHVEDLVVAEHGGRRVPAARVRRRPRRPCRAAPPARRRRSSRADRRRQLPEVATPRPSRAPPRPTATSHFGASIHSELEDHPAERARPHGRSAPRAPSAAVQRQQRERRVGPGDQHEDHRVVQAAHPAPGRAGASRRGGRARSCRAAPTPRARRSPPPCRAAAARERGEHQRRTPARREPHEEDPAQARLGRPGCGAHALGSRRGASAARATWTCRHRL